jgi:hypothetical protein
LNQFLLFLIIGLGCEIASTACLEIVKLRRIYAHLGELSERMSAEHRRRHEDY